MEGTTALDKSAIDHALRLAAQHFQDSAPPEPVAVVGPRLWFVVQSIVRGEEDAAKALKDWGCSTYLPKMRKEIFSRRARTVVTREFNLFNRYLFAELPADPKDWAFVYDIEAVDGVLGANGKPCPVKETEVRRFMKAEEELEFDETREAKIKRREIGRTRRQTTLLRYPVGRKIRALRGPFGGFAAHVHSVTGRGTIEAMLKLFGQMTVVEFPLDMVEPA